MTETDGRVPGFLGRVMTPTGAPAGTCFQIAPGVLVTAWHVLRDLHADEPTATVHIEPLGDSDGRNGFDATVVRTKPEADLAVLTAHGALPESIVGMADTDSVAAFAEVKTTGVARVYDPGHVYEFVDALGRWGGNLSRDGQSLGQVISSAIMQGMSGSPIWRLPDGYVVGVVTARYNTDEDGWLRDRAWIARTEDLRPLLQGLADPASAPMWQPATTIEATLTIDTTQVHLGAQGTTVSAEHGGMPYRLVEGLQRLQRERLLLTGLRDPNAAVATDEGAAATGMAAGLTEQVGRLLGEVFLPEPIAARLTALVQTARSRTSALRLGLRVEGELRQLPWETMSLPDGSLPTLALSVQVFRVAETAAPMQASAGPLRILVAISAPLSGGGAILDYERELRNVVAAVRDARALGRAQVQVVQFATTAEIRHALQEHGRAGRPVHVLHISAHGGPGLLELEDDNGTARRISAEQLVAEAIPDGLMPPVIALSACHTDAASASGDSTFATGLLERGASVVIATQTAITDRYATRVFGQIYGQLAAGDSDIIAAVATARQTVHHQLTNSPNEDDQRLARLGEWAVLRVHAAPGPTRLIDSALPETVDAYDTIDRSGLLGRGVGEVVGRRREQRLWPAKLLASDTAGIVIYGLGGIGKTTLADELCARIREQHPTHLIASLYGQISGEQMVAELAAVVHEHFQNAGGMTTQQIAATLIDKARDLDRPWLDRLDAIRRYLQQTAAGLLLVLDNFEDNLAGVATSVRDVASTGLPEVLTAISARPGAMRLLITSRYQFRLPQHREQLLQREPLGPLSFAETLKLAWALPALDRLSPNQLMDVWRAVGGHPRSLEYLDALLSAGIGRYPDVKARLIDTLTRRLPDGDDAADIDIDGYLRSHSQLDTALAETAALTADDIILPALLNDLDSVAHARDVLYGTAVYRRPVDTNALLFQLYTTDPELELQDQQRRQTIPQKINDLLIAAGIPQSLVNLDQVPPPLRQQVIELAAGQRPRAPVNGPTDLRPAIRACTATSLLALAVDQADTSVFVHRSTATALHQLQQAQQQVEQLVTGHLRAAAYWQWRVRVWPQDKAADIDDLIEAHHHVTTAIGLGRTAAIADLARIDHELQGELGTAGRRADALSYAQEAVTIYRRLAATNPAAFEPDLAMALNNLGIRLSNLGQRDAALTATQEAVTIYRRLAATNPAAFEPDLASALNNLGIRLSNLGQRDAALTATQEAVTIRRRLAATNPAAFEPNLAIALWNIGWIHAQHNTSTHEAIADAEEAVAIYSRLAQRLSAAHQPTLRAVATTLAKLYDLANNPDAATAVRDRYQLDPS